MPRERAVERWGGEEAGEGGEAGGRKSAEAMVEMWWWHASGGGEGEVEVRSLAAAVWVRARPR